MYLRLNCVYMSLPRSALSMNNLTTVHRQIKTLLVLNLVLRSSTTSIHRNYHSLHNHHSHHNLCIHHNHQSHKAITTTTATTATTAATATTEKKGTDLIPLRATNSESLLLLSNNTQTDRLRESNCIHAGEVLWGFIKRFMVLAFS